MNTDVPHTVLRDVRSHPDRIKCRSVRWQTSGWAHAFIIIPPMLGMVFGMLHVSTSSSSQHARIISATFSRYVRSTSSNVFRTSLSASRTALRFPVVSKTGTAISDLELGSHATWPGNALTSGTRTVSFLLVHSAHTPFSMERKTHAGVP